MLQNFIIKQFKYNMAFEHCTFYVFEWQIEYLYLIKTLKMLNLCHFLENTKRFFSEQRKLAKYYIILKVKCECLLNSMLQSLYFCTFG